MLKNEFKVKSKHYDLVYDVKILNNKENDVEVSYLDENCYVRIAKFKYEEVIKNLNENYWIIVN